MLDLKLGVVDRSLNNKEVWAGIRRLFDLIRSPDGWIVRLHISGYPSVGEYPSLHGALTRGFKVTSNLTAYLLLEDWSQPDGKDEPGVHLWHPAPMEDYPCKGESEYYLKATIHALGLIGDETLGIVRSHRAGSDWTVRSMRDVLDDNDPNDAVCCATEEQAVATALKHAAPWTARYMIEAFIPSKQEKKEGRG
jgi:hypothetical protein